MTDQPTTRDQLIEQAARAIATEGPDGMAVDVPETYRYAARALADAGLLTDPEQHAELLRAQADVRQWKRVAEERNAAAREIADLRDKLATAREETAAARDLAEMRAEDRTTIDVQLEERTAERDALQARIDAVPNILRQHYLAWIDAVNAWIEHVRAALQGAQPAEPSYFPDPGGSTSATKVPGPLIAPDDPCQDFRCTRVDGRCVGSHCGRCGGSSSSQGHYTSICRNKPIPKPLASNAPFHFCCPDDCELAARPTGEADRG